MNLFDYSYMKSKYKSKIENFLESLGYKNVFTKFTKTIDHANGLLVEMGFEEGYRKFRIIGVFKLVEMPGCCGILISTGTSINKEFQGKGIAKFLQTIKEEMAIEAGYTELYCTAVDDNGAQVHILESFGWKKVNTFINRRTGHSVSEYIKSLVVEIK